MAARRVLRAACAIAPILLELVQEGGNEGGIHVRQEQAARCFAKAFLGETEEEPESIAVGGDGMGTRLALPPEGAR